jgi:hypothetical protein
MTAMDMAAKENADYSPKAIPCLILAMSDFGTFETCSPILRMSVQRIETEVIGGRFKSTRPTI